MESLATVESFLRSAETGSFSAAARALGLTPAAVSRNVATLERRLGVRLFQRSTRRLSLTERGEVFLRDAGGPFAALQAALAVAATDREEPAGVLRVSLSLGFGTAHILPLLPGFLARFPRVTPDWRFENRAVDLVGEGFDAAIGGIERAPGIIARPLAPAHLIAVAAPSWLDGRTPGSPAQLAALDGIVLRSERTGRVQPWILRNAAGREEDATPVVRVVVNDPVAMREAALLGLGVALLAMPDALRDLESGALARVLPGWRGEAGTISLAYPHRALLPAKTRAFVDFVLEAFRRGRLAERFAAGP